MEIDDLLRAARGRLRAIALLALVAGALAAVLVLNRPPEYTATALVYLPDGGTLTSFSVDPVAANVTSALQLSTTRAAAQKLSGVPTSVLRSGLATSHTTGDSSVELRLTAPSAQMAETGARALGQSALLSIANRQAAVAALAVQGARQSLATADRNAETLTRALGVVDVDAALTQLSAQIAQARTGPNPTQLRNLRAEADRLIGQRAEFQALTAARSAAQDSLTRSLQTAADAQAQAAYARSQEAVVPQSVDRVDLRTPLLRAVLGAMVAAALLGALVLAPLTYGRRRRNVGRGAAPSADEADEDRHSPVRLTAASDVGASGS